MGRQTCPESKIEENYEVSKGMPCSRCHLATWEVTPDPKPRVEESCVQVQPVP